MAEPNFEMDSIPVMLARGAPCRSGFPPCELCNMLNALEQPDLRIIQAGAVKKMRLDARSRARDDNRLRLTEKSTKIVTARKINKGLTMEMVMSSLLTFVDHPDEVVSRCVANRRGKPNNFAQGEKPDIVFHPAHTDPSFQVVCEVSANKEMKDETYREQLVRGLEHAFAEHSSTGVKVTYLFVANLRKIGEDKDLQALYREFQADDKTGLHPTASIRVVPMRASEFATAVRRLHHEDKLRFRSPLLAQAFDAVHEKTWAESWPEEEDWMAKIFVETVRKAYRSETRLLEPRI